MDEAIIILNSAYLVLVASTFTRNVLSLRIALMVGAAGFVLYGVVTENLTVAAWNSVTGGLHSIQLVRYVAARRAVELTEDDETWRDRLFPDLDRFDFYTLWSMGEEFRLTDMVLAEAGDDHNRVAVVLAGHVEVRSGDDVVATLGQGAMLGEMSYVSGLPANRDVFAVGEVRLRVWDQPRVRALDQLNPRAGRAFNAFVQRDLASKLT